MNARQPSALFYLLAVLLCLGGWVAALTIASGDWDELKDATVRPVGNVQLDSEPGRVAVFTDTLQPKRHISCAVTDPSGSSYRAHPAALELEANSGGVRWHLFAITDEIPDPAAVSISCTPRDRTVDNARYGASSAPEFRGATVGNGIGSLATLAAVILTLWT